MKIKLISLLIALLCVSVLFVSCSDECTTHLDADGDGVCDTEGCEDIVQLPEPEEPNCTNHVDANNDGLCDTENCGTVIITNTIEDRVEVLVPIEKEEYVPMVVKPIPADANVSDYVVITYENGLLTLYTHEYTPVDSLKIVNNLGNHYYIIKTASKVSDPVADDPATSDVNEFKYATRKDTYTLVNDLTGYSKVLAVTEPYDFEEDNAATPDTNEYWDNAPSFNYSNYGSYKRVTISGEGFYYYTNNYTLINEEATDLGLDVEDGYNGVYYFYFDDAVYVVDEEGNITYTDKEMFFIERPDFDAMTDAYGIIETDGKLAFFDLTKWLECTYSYEFSAMSETDWFVLQNGNVLVQVANMLPDYTVNYDAISDGTKIDVDYFIIDPVAKTVTETEFGYVIMEVYPAIEDAEGVTDKVENIFVVLPIENGVVASDIDMKLLVVSNSLEIACDLTNIADGDLVSKDFIVKEVYMNGTEFVAVYDTAGKFLNYLPKKYDTFADCIILGDDEGVYSYDLKLKLDLTKYYEVDFNGSYMILVEEIVTKVEEEDIYSYKTYYWNTSLEAPVLLFDDASQKEIYTTTNDYYVIDVPTIFVDPDTQQKSISGWTKAIYSNNGTLTCEGVASYDFSSANIDGEIYTVLFTETITVTPESTIVTRKNYIVNDVAPAPAPAPAPAA